MKRLIKTLLISSLLLILSTLSAQAAVFDSNEYLTPEIKQRIEHIIKRAEDYNLDITVTITNEKELSEWGSSVGNANMEFLTQSLLAKETMQRHEGFAFTVVRDHKGKNGLTPAIRYAANDKFSLNQEQVEKLLKDFYRTSYWEKQLPLFLDELVTETGQQQQTNLIIVLVVVSLFVIGFLVMIVRELRFGSRGSSSIFSIDMDGFDSGGGSDGGGGFSGGD